VLAIAFALKSAADETNASLLKNGLGANLSLNLFLSPMLTGKVSGLASTFAGFFHEQ
jgi:hypothetical protein